MITSQMLKGTLEGCILQIIEKKEIYGYEISQKLNAYGFYDISEGTIYPMLLRLEKNGFIKAEYKVSNQGPNRKYFSLTQNGENELRQFKISWSELKYAVDNIINPEA